MSTSAEQTSVVEGESESEPGESETEAVGEAEVMDLPLDDVFHLLQSTRRRLVIKHMRGCEEEVVMRDLVEEVAADEYDTTVEALDSKRRQRVYIALYQRHLPKLDEAGVVDYNQDRGIVKRLPLAETVEARLADAAADQQSATPAPAAPEIETDGNPPAAFLGAAGVSLALVASIALGFTPAALSGGALPAVAVLATFIAAFAYEHLTNHETQPF